MGIVYELYPLIFVTDVVLLRHLAISLSFQVIRSSALHDDHEERDNGDQPR